MATSVPTNDQLAIVVGVSNGLWGGTKMCARTLKWAAFKISRFDSDDVAQNDSESYDLITIITMAVGGISPFNLPLGRTQSRRSRRSQ